MQGPLGAPNVRAGNNDRSSGVVQWFVPPTTKSNREDRDKQVNTGPFRDRSNTDDFTTSIWHSETGSAVDGKKQVLKNGNSRQKGRVSSDSILCRTIGTFVEQHLKDLQEHQRLIDNVRSSLHNNSYDHQELIDSGLISQQELTKIRVRDEQIKAIETIKQLTSYLRELSRIKSQYDSSQEDQADDEIVNTISEQRMEIIQALNDFVLCNSDIDVPICTTSDIHEYDLCIDAKKMIPYPLNGEKSRANYSNIHYISQDAARQQTEGLLADFDEPEDLDGHEQTVAETQSDGNLLKLEKRKKEMEKLCKDTIELRRLFSDFYNLIKTQGEQMDTIEENIVIATQKIREGQQNINRARRGMTVLMPMTGCITGALLGGPIGLVIGSKVGGLSIVCVASLVGLISSYSAHRCLLSSKLKDD